MWVGLDLCCAVRGMTELRLSVLARGKPSSSQLYVEVADEEVTCRELVTGLLKDGALEHPGKRGAWHLVERWNGCERRMGDEERVMDTVNWQGGERVWLKCEGVRDGGVRRWRRRDYLRGPLTAKKLSRLRDALRQYTLSTSTQASSLWLQRLAQGKSLSGDFPLEPLRERLGDLRQHNLKLSTEISQLNISAGGLERELHALRAEESGLSDGMRSVEEVVRVGREERERESSSRLAHLHSEIIRLKRELETRNRLNAVQGSRLHSQEMVLEEKRKYTVLKREHKSHVTGETLSRDPVTTPPISRAGSQDSTPQSPGHTPSSSARKKRAVFEARTRQLLEAEGEEFRRQREGERGGGRNRVAKQLEFSSTTPPATPPGDHGSLLSADMLEEGQRLLSVPSPDHHWYRSSPEPSYRDKIDRVLGGGAEVKGQSDNFFSEVMKSVEQRQSVGGVKKRRHTQKKVCFSPEAILLPACLEGDLETVMECIQQLGSCGHTSHKGATCLHNAVCSGSKACVEYITDIGCDINAQDDDGWTPLHCAVAYSNRSAVDYLLTHGASLWLETEEEGDSALRLAERELQREEREEGELDAAQHCLDLLKKAHGELGVVNGGVVYALFPHCGSGPGEVSVCEGESMVVVVRGGEGEGWWRVETVSGGEGLVPVTILGSRPRLT